MAAEKDVGGLVLDAPYTSIVDVAAVSYPYLPVRPFVLDRYETMKFLPQVTAPLLVLHGEDDSVVPVEMGKAVMPPPMRRRRSPPSRAPDTRIITCTDRTKSCFAGSTR